MALSVCNSTTDLHQKELLKYRDAAFPIGCYEDDLSILHVPWHWHDEWEFILVTQGTLVVLLLDVRITLRTGDGLFINSRTLHALDGQASQNAILHSAVFHPKLIGGSKDSIYWDRLVLPMLKENAPQSIILRRENTLHRQMLDDFHKAWEAVALEWEDYENLTRYQLSKVWRSLCQNCIDKSTNPSMQDRVDAERIRAMLEYIESNLAAALNTRRIAESVNISESVCLRCFHRMLGTTPIQYVKQLRLEKAAELLRNTSQTAKAIALECGFRDVSYFTKAFREKMGCTPGAYQNGK